MSESGRGFINEFKLQQCRSPEAQVPSSYYDEHDQCTTKANKTVQHYTLMNYTAFILLYAISV